MPYYKSATECGDLFIRFNLVIPKSIESKNLLKLKEIFELSSENILSEKFDVSYCLENVSDSDLEDSESESGSDSDSDESVSSVSSDSSEEVKFKSKRSLKR